MSNEQDKQHLQELAAYRFTVENLRERVVELEAQLEIDYRHPYDGIAARDVTIKALDDRIAELEADLEAVGAGGVQSLRKQAAAPQAVQPAIMPKGESAAAQLRAMATNYPAGHNWDKLDARACIRGALEIEALRALLAAAPAHPADGVPVPMPVAHPHHCKARTADGSCEECEGHAQAMAEWNADRTALAATHPTQQGLEPIEQRQLAIGQAVERACKELPEGVEIQIYLERGAGTVHMTDWDGNEFDHFDEAHNDFACRINAATDGAIAADKVAAQAKHGGA